MYKLLVIQGLFQDIVKNITAFKVQDISQNISIVGWSPVYKLYNLALIAKDYTIYFKGI